MIDAVIARGLLPDSVIRLGIKSLLKKRLNEESQGDFHQQDQKKKNLIGELKLSPIAVETDLANDQHYMVPPAFFQLCLGPRLKYSCCHWDQAQNLGEAEEEMLALTVKRAAIQDGDTILELGHGWGAITLYMAEKFPNSKITAVSNSIEQGKFILEKAAERGFKNIEIITADVANFNIDRKFDRVISIEMFEHMRNYQELLGRISSWLTDQGTLFVHVFVHKNLAYKFDVVDSTDWMSRYFFSGGIMPSDHLFYHFQKDLKIREHWRVKGTHYSETARAWLDNMDKNKKEIMEIFSKHYSQEEANKWFHYWRVFFMSCEELWKYKSGTEWHVSHYLFGKE